MINNIFFNSNPFDEIDNEIKYHFSKKYGLCLNKLNYDVFGIIDDCFLVSLIGESSMFHVYLGYKYGLFYSVKVMKRNRYESKEVLNSRIEQFEREVDLRLRLQNQDVAKNLVKIHYVNYQKFIIYEEYCVNGMLSCYSNLCMSEKLVRTIFLNLVSSLRNLNEGSRLYHTNINLDDIVFDNQFSFKVIGVRNLKYSIFASSIFYESMATENEEETNQVVQLVIMLCKILFKEDYERILPFLRNNLKAVDLKAKDEEFKNYLSKELDAENFLSKNYYNSSLSVEIKVKDNSNISSNGNEEMLSPKEVRKKKEKGPQQDEINLKEEVKEETNFFDFDSSSNDEKTAKDKKHDKLFDNLKPLENITSNVIQINNENNYSLSLSTNQVLNSNLDFLDGILSELISKYQLTSSIRNEDHLKEFLKKLIKDKTLEDIEFTHWFNGELLDSYEYFYEMNNMRSKALEKNFQNLALKEKNLITKRKGIFKVIK